MSYSCGAILRSGWRRDVGSRLLLGLEDAAEGADLLPDLGRQVLFGQRFLLEWMSVRSW
jgi:hypothetical protein